MAYNNFEKTLPISIYDIELQSAGGAKSNILSSQKGKVTLIFNVAAGCGNIPQHSVIEELNQKYKDENNFLIKHKSDSGVLVEVRKIAWVSPINHLFFHYATNHRLRVLALQLHLAKRLLFKDLLDRLLGMNPAELTVVFKYLSCDL